MKKMHVFTALFAFVLFAAVASAAGPVDVSTDRSGLALQGHDPVGYFTDSEPVRGSAKFETTYGGATYRFASAANRDTFLADPAHYAPQFGGFCAYGMTLGKKFDTDPAAWRIVDGKLYLNKNRSVQKTWIKDIPGNLVKAEAQWPKVRSVPADKL